MTPELKAAILALLGDIDEMKVSEDDGWYGPFEASYNSDDDTALIEWPNLRISAEKLRALLPPESEG